MLYQRRHQYKKEIKFKFYGERELLDKNAINYKDIASRIQFFHHMNARDEFHISCEIDEKIIGLVGLQQNPNSGQENMIWIKFCSVDPDFRNKGIATSLMQRATKWALKNEKLLKPSSYTDDGEKYLSRIVDRLKDEYPEAFVSSGYNYSI